MLEFLGALTSISAPPKLTLLDIIFFSSFLMVVPAKSKQIHASAEFGVIF